MQLCVKTEFYINMLENMMLYLCLLRRIMTLSYINIFWSDKKKFWINLFIYEVCVRFLLF